jgi:hypothetical protein
MSCAHMEEIIYQTKKIGYLIIACQEHGDLLNARLEYFKISGEFFIGCETYVLNFLKIL